MWLYHPTSQLPYFSYFPTSCRKGVPSFFFSWLGARVSEGSDCMKAFLVYFKLRLIGSEKRQKENCVPFIPSHPFRQKRHIIIRQTSSHTNPSLWKHKIAGCESSVEQCVLQKNNILPLYDQSWFFKRLLANFRGSQSVWTTLYKQTKA